MRIAKKNKEMLRACVRDGVFSYLVKNNPNLIHDAPDTWDDEEKAFYDSMASLEIGILDDMEAVFDS